MTAHDGHGPLRCHKDCPAYAEFMAEMHDQMRPDVTEPVARRDDLIEPWTDAAEREGWDSVDGDVLYWAAVDAVAWALIEATSDTADREPSAETVQDARVSAERIVSARAEALPFEPPGLRDLIASMAYKPGWTLSLGLFREDGEARAWAFYVVSDTEDSIKPGQRIRVRHEFLVPPASWKRDVWAAWLVDRLGDVEMHERNEFVRFDGVREFAPHHGNGEDPYRTWHVSDYATAAKRAGED